MEELMYQAVPFGQKPAKLDPYGNPVTKTGIAPLRPIDVSDTGTTKVNPVDTMLLVWSDKHPDKAWFPSAINKATFKNAKTGKEVEMNQAQLVEFREQSGKRASALLKLQKINTVNPTELDIKKVKDIITKSRSDMKAALRHKFSKQ
jgi:hypothetical protein